MGLLGILTWASVAQAGTVIRIVPRLPTLGKPPAAKPAGGHAAKPDGTDTSAPRTLGAGLSGPLPASQSFVLELSAADAGADRVTVVIVPEDKRCTVNGNTDFAREDIWGDCPQHYVLEMTAATSGGERVLQATVPPLQVDQGYHLYLQGSAPLNPILLSDMPLHVAHVVLARAQSGLAGPVQCKGDKPVRRPIAQAYDPTSDIAAAFADAINDAIQANTSHVAPRQVRAEDMQDVAIKAAREIQIGEPAPAAPAAPAAAPAAPVADPAAAAHPAVPAAHPAVAPGGPAPADGAVGPAQPGSIGAAALAPGLAPVAGVITDTEHWIDSHLASAQAHPKPAAPAPAAPAAPLPAAPSPAAPPPAIGPAPAPHTAPAAPAPRPAAPAADADPLASFIDRRIELQDAIDRSQCAGASRARQLDDLQNDLALLPAPRAPRVLDARGKLVALPSLLDGATTQATLQGALPQLQQLADRYDGPHRDAVQPWLVLVASLAQAKTTTEHDAAVKAWKATGGHAWPIADYVFVGPFGDRKAATRRQLVPSAGADRAADPIADSTALREQLEVYEAAESNELARQGLRDALISARALERADKQLASYVNYQLAHQDQFTAAAAALEARVMSVMSDLKADPELRIQTRGIQVFSVVGYGVTTDAGNFASPDFGVAFAFPRSAQGSYDTWLLPYFGLNLYAVPVDRKIPLSRLAAEHHPALYRIAQRASLTVGLTLSNPSIAGYQVSGPLANRYPIAALGVRLTHFIRLTGGAVFYRISSQNPVDATSRLAAAPFVGLSVDTDVIDIAKNGISHL
ncbi:MAG TPA: hypothetical protein VH165_19530 [Kofleriaceae bacterium]|nr:hypothetical protein [Kofleriaceae bacterium]